jgi:hypothetical protein
MKLALHVPVNAVSFGQVSTMLLRTLYEREKAGTLGIDLYLFPIGGSDLSAQNVDEDFKSWLNSKVSKAYETYTRDIPIFKLWHLNGSFESFGCKQTLLSFYELDNPTKIEINIARNSKLALSSQFSVDVFKMFGVDAQLLPLGFDSYNFSVINKKYHQDDRIVFNLCGKFERRKYHAKIIQAWIKKFGNNPKVVLQCATYNPFLDENQNNEIIRQVVGGQKPFNVAFFPMMRENSTYNDFLNSGHIIIGMSGGEGWGLPEFHSVALGKHAVLLNAHGYKTWADDSLATLVQPSGKVSAVDNLFFKQGEPFNQGNIFDWNEDDFIAGCEKAIEKAKQNPVNTNGLSLQTKFSKDLFADNVIKLATT